MFEEICRSTFLLLYLFYSTAFAKNPENVILENSAESNTITKDNIEKFAQSAENIGRSLEYLIIANVNDVKMSGSALGKGKMVLTKIPMFSAIFSSIGFMLKIGLILAGVEQKSEMMKLLERNFDEMNKKLDMITADLDENRNLIKISSQKAAYITAENKILEANGSLKKFFSDLAKLKCSDKSECLKKKMLIAKSYVNSFDVQKEVDMILRGATSDKLLFGDSLLRLTKENSKCDVNEIKHKASLITGLSMKGVIAAMLYDSLTTPDFDMARSVETIHNELMKLERMKNLVITECFVNIDRYLRSDVRHLNHKYSSGNIAQTNRIISSLLRHKYFWMRLYVITIRPIRIFGRIAEPAFWSNEQIMRDLSVIDSRKQSYSYVLIGSNNDIYERKTKHDLFMKRKKNMILWKNTFFRKQEYNIEGLVADKNDGFSKEYIRASIFLRSTDRSVISYPTTDGKIIQQDTKALITKNDVKDFFYGTWDETTKEDDDIKVVYTTYVIALIQTRNMVPECSLNCNSRGKCFFLAYSNTMNCFCDEGYSGNSCQTATSVNTLAFDYSSIVKMTSFQLTTSTDIKYDLDRLHTSILVSTGNVRTEINRLSNKINNIVGDMIQDMKSQLQWQGLVTQYGEVIQDLKYYHDILTDNAFQDRTDDKFIEEEVRILAEAAANPDKVEKYLQLVNYLFVGRQDVPLLNHKSLIFAEMDRNIFRGCSSLYKNAIDNARKMLAILQMQGYMTWILALKYIGSDTIRCHQQYKQVMRDQKKYLDRHTCSIAIPQSSNLQKCTGGYYVYNGMPINVNCKDTYYLTGEILNTLYFYSLKRFVL